MNKIKLDYFDFRMNQEKYSNGIYDVEGDIYYIVEGKYHRIDGPAIEIFSIP